MSRAESKYRSLSKAYRIEIKKPNPDKEVILMLTIEMKKIESAVGQMYNNQSYQDSLNQVKK